VNKTKKNTRDFALWKTSKEKGEPSWASPWGKGRPGWHIECSAMTHYVLGDRLDIHSGGIDLRFPHHNNEIAQCEAHNGCSHWCNHFIHFGHLYIQGLKMSKSLKNFISIRDFLEKHSADELRLFCLQFKYRSNIHYSDDRVRDASSISYRIKSFLSNVKAYANEQKQKALEGRAKSRCEPKDLEMLNFLFQTKVNVDAALANDFDTPEALRRILELISRTNEYIITSNEVPIETLYSVVKYVLEIIDLFGLEGILKEYSQVSHFFHLLTHEQQSRHDSNCSNNKSNEAILNTFIKFRAAVRGAALQNHDRSAGEILKLCDQVRNEDLIGLGIQVEDIAPGRSVFKFISKEKLNEKKIAEDKELARKEAEKKALLEKQKEFEHLMQISPKDFFTLSLEYIGKYTQFDEEVRRILHFS
jgi:cysteinyl-tRNA synthetase